MRLEFYAGKLFTRQDIRGKGKTFDDLKQSYQVSLLVNKRFFDDANVVHCFEYYDPEQQISLGGRSRIVTVELSKLAEIVEKPVEKMTQEERWSVFFKYSAVASKRQTINQIIAAEEDIAMACKVLRTVSKDKLEQSRLLIEYKFEVDTQSRIVQAERTGLAKGLAKGLSQGRAEATPRISFGFEQR